MVKTVDRWLLERIDAKECTDVVDTVRVGGNTTVSSDSSHKREKETTETVKVESRDDKKI